MSISRIECKKCGDEVEVSEGKIWCLQCSDESYNPSQEI